MAYCPNCGGDKFRYELRSNGSRGRSYQYRYGNRGVFIPSGTRTYSSQKSYDSIGFCPDCGYVERQEDGNNDENIAKFVVYGILILVLLRFCIPLAFFLGLIGFLGWMVKAAK